MPRLILIVFILFSGAVNSEANNYSYRDSKSFSSDDFLYKENSELRDRSFSNYTIVDAGLDLGISSGGCGQIDIHKTLRGSLKGIMDERIFKEMGADLAGSSFMLLTCYWSPQICSILKNARVQASMLGKLRYDQCGAINKYVDSRVEDWELSRQKCFNNALNSNGGDADAAMEKCGKNSFDYDLANWSGGGSEVKVNRLIESSSEWMGLKGAESKRIINITKAFVGDSVLSRGKLQVDFGPRKRALSPRVYYQEQRRGFEAKMRKIFEKVDSSGGTHQIAQVVTDDDLKELSGNDEARLVGKDTLESLYRMPHAKRRVATQKLASTVALHKLATDANKSLDLLTVAEQNPNLPKNRKEEIREKRRALKESLETTIFLEKQKNEPINHVLKKISDDGKTYQSRSLKSNLKVKGNQENSNSLNDSYFNCADGFMCLR